MFNVIVITYGNGFSDDEESTDGFLRRRMNELAEGRGNVYKRVLSNTLDGKGHDTRQEYQFDDTHEV